MTSNLEPSNIGKTKKPFFESIKIAIIISYVALISSVLLNLFFTPFLISKVGDDYGVYSFSESMITWFTVLFTALAASFIRFSTQIKTTKDQESPQTNTIFFFLLLLSAIATVLVGLVTFFLFFFGVIPLSSFTPSQKSLFCWIFLVSILFSALLMITSFFVLYCTFRLKFVLVRSVDLLTTLLYPAFSFILLEQGGGMLGVTLVLFAVKLGLSSLLTLYSFFSLKIRFAKMDLKADGHLIRTILSFSFFILVNSIIDAATDSIGKVSLGFFEGAGLVTIYELGSSFARYANTMSMAISNNYIPSINSLCKDQNMEEINRIFRRVGLAQAIITLLMVGGFVSCGKEFVLMWVGEEKIQVFDVAVFFLCLCSFPYCENVSIEYQRAMNKHHFRAYVYFASLVVSIVTTMCLLAFARNMDPIVSCLIGYGVSYFLSRWILNNLYNRKIGLDVVGLFRWFLLLAICAAISCGGSVGIQGIILSLGLHLGNLVIFLIKGILFVVFYCCLLLVVFHLFKKNQDIIFLKGKMPKVFDKQKKAKKNQ